MKKKPLLLLAILFYSSFTIAQIYVAKNGNDGNTGTLASPCLTIQKAASVATAGQTVYVRTGTYRETVTPANSGTAGNPITYQAYNDETVIISGTEVITGWGIHTGNIYKAAMPSTFLDRSHNQDDQIFVDGKMMFCAKWPNQTVLDPTYPAKSTMTSFVSKTRSGNVTNSDGFQNQQFQGMGLYIAGNDNIVRNCNIKYSAGHGIIIAGRRGQVTNNTITDVGYQ